MNFRNHPLLETESLGYLLLNADVKFSAEQSALFVLFHALQQMLIHPKISEPDYIWLLSLVAHRQFELWGQQQSCIEKKILQHLREIETMKELQKGPRNTIQRILRPQDEYPTSSSVCLNKAYNKVKNKDSEVFLEEASEVEYRNLWFYMAFTNQNTSSQLKHRYEFGDLRKESLLCEFDEQVQEQGLHHPALLHDAICQHVLGIDREAFLHEKDMPIIGSAEKGARLAALNTMITHLEVMSVRISRMVECPLRPLDLNSAQQQTFSEVLKSIQSWNLRGLFGSDSSEHSEKADLIIHMIHQQAHPAMRQKLKNAIMRNIHEAIEVFEDLFVMTQCDPTELFLDSKTQDERGPIPIESSLNPLLKEYPLRRAV